MRTWLIAVAAVVVGSCTGIGLTYYEFRAVKPHFQAQVDGLNRDTVEDPDADLPRVVVGASQFDFGSLERHQSGEHTFVIRNEGRGELQLNLEGVSCGQCVETEFEMATVPPRESYELKVKFITRKRGPDFAESVDISTNDPRLPMLELGITGYVTHEVGFSVDEEVTLGSISASEETTTTFQVFTFKGEKLEITDASFVSPHTAEYFQIDFAPLSAAEFRPQQERATAAVQATLRVKKGLPLGPLSQTIRMTAALSGRTTTVELPIRGSVVGDIVVYGPRNFNRDNSLLRLRTVRRGEGATALLQLRVKGPHRDEIKPEVGEIDPASALKATIGSPKELGEDAGYLFPLTIEVDKQAPTVNRLGTQQGKVGVIVIRTNHPEAKELRIHVSFAIQ